MEKLVYLLWSNHPDSGDAFRDALLTELPSSLRSKGAERLKISVTDSAVEAGAALHLGPLAPQAMVSFWVECIQDRAPLEQALDRACERKVGYLVAESQPLVYDASQSRPGERSRGFSLVGCIEPSKDVTHAEFIERWETVHRDVAIETQSTFSYVRNEVVRAVTPDAPAWGGIVEEGFPIEALDDRRVFYDAGDSQSLFEENSRRMVESCLAFISLDNVDSHPMSEYRFF